MNKKLVSKLDSNEITQTRRKSVEVPATASASPGSRRKIESIWFKEEVINKIKKNDYKKTSCYFRESPRSQF